MNRNIASMEDLSSELEPDYEISDEDDEKANTLPDISPSGSDILRESPPVESPDYHSDEPFLCRSVVGTVKDVEGSPEEARPVTRFQEPSILLVDSELGRAADPVPIGAGPGLRDRGLEAPRSGMDHLVPEAVYQRERKKSDIELEIEQHLEDDPEFGDSLNELIRQKQVRRTLKPKRGKSQRWSLHSSARSASSEGSRTGSRREDDVLDIYRLESVTTTTKDDIKDNLKIQHDILSSVREQPWRMKRKLRTLRLAKSYVQKYEGHLSKGQGYQEAGAKFWRKVKRMVINLAIIFIPWEMRIKKIESHFGSVVSSYFTFLRWLVGVNIILASITMGFIVIPEILVGKPRGSTPAKTVPPEELPTALNLMTIIDFEGYIKYSVFFYGFYGSEPVIGDGYRLPLAYFLAGLSTYALSFIIILRRMAYNSRLGRMASKDEQYTFSWRLFTNWDYMIGNTETAKNKAAEIATSFRELILEEQEKKRKENKKLLIFLRIVANSLVITVLASSSYAIFLVVKRSESFEQKMKEGLYVSWYERNEVSIIMSLITALYPSLFDLIGLMEKYHPRINLRWQLARILVLYLLNLYTLIIALYHKILVKKINNTSCNTMPATVNYPTERVIVNASNHTSDWLTGNVTMAPISTAATNQNCSLADEDDDLQCWETMIGQEIMKLTAFDTVIAVAFIFVIDFIRGLWVRYCNSFWCWDLETKFPEYGEFKIAENILHLIYNQAMVWMGTFFSPVLPIVNLLKLLIMLYVRSWAVLMCNIPHERVFKASRSNNFYFALLLLMLFLVTLPLIYLLMVVRPSLDCGPFSGLEKSYYIFTNTIEAEFPSWLNRVVFYTASPGVILPAFLLMSMTIFYLISLSRSYKEANRDLRMQLHYERTEEKRKIYAMADARAKRSFQLRQQQQQQQQHQRVKDVNSPLLSSTPNPTSGSAVSRYGSIESAPKSNARPPRKVKAQVIRLPNLTEQQAAALRRQNANVHVITAREARQRGILPAEESSVTSYTHPQSLANTSHITPPVAIVQGNPLIMARFDDIEEVVLSHGSKEQLLS